MSKYLAIKWTQVGERADCLELLTKHQTFKEVPLERVLHKTFLVDLTGIK